MGKRVVIGIDLGGTNIKVGLFDTELTLLGRKSAATDAASGPEHVIERIADTTREILAARKLDMRNVRAAGIGAPGPSNIKEGIIAFAPNMPGFENVHMKKMLAERLKVPVVFENDANAACWGEYVAGVGKGVSDMVLLTLGTGIGGGVVSNGRLLHGYDDAAAELGHTIIYSGGRQCGCGQRGCVEAYASANSTAARATEALREGRLSSLNAVLESRGAITSRDVYEHVAAGDELAREIADGTARALAILCINLLHTTGPELIAFAGGMIGAGDLLISGVQRFFDELIWSSKKERVRLVQATLGESAGMVGAAALAVDMG